MSDIQNRIRCEATFSNGGSMFNTGRSISLIIKTVNACNLDCTYCYAPKIQSGKHKTISEQVLVKIIKGTVDLGVQNVELVWHGSEPLIAGIDFFNRALEIQKEFGQPWQNFHNVMQTNATLIDESWLRFFKENNFGVGISIDGPANIHNANRLTRGGERTHHLVLENFEKLKNAHCDGGICAVVSRDSLGFAEDIVDFFAQIKVPEVDLLPCFPSETNESSNNKEIIAEEYSRFMIDAFDRWFDIDDPDFSIRFFDNVIRLMMGGESQFCKFRPDKCTNFLGIDTDGSVYPCDLFVGYAYWKLGSLETHDLASIMLGSRKREFYRCMENVNEECFQCKWYRMCWGGCSLHRYLADKDLNELSIFCQSRKDIFTHISEVIELEPPKPHHRPLKFASSVDSNSISGLYVDLGPACNANCYFCAASSTDKKDVKPISNNNLILLQEAQNKGVDSLVISGGEATIHKDLLDFVSSARKMGYRKIELQTNGRKISNQEYLIQLIEAGVTDFGISLHGDTPDLQDFITRSPGSFETTIRAIENISLIFGPNPPIATNSVITPENKSRLNQIIDLLLSYNVSTIKLSYLHGMGRAAEFFKNRDWPNKLALQPYILDAIMNVELKGKLNTSLAIEAYPSCLLPGFEMYSSDFFIACIYRADTNGKIRKYHTREDRIKGPNCGQCILSVRCLGPWKEYPSVYGWEEFVPITKPIDFKFDFQNPNVCEKV